MKPVIIRRALLSVSDKTGLVDLARALAGIGVELISTGGTRKALTEAGLTVRDIAEVTGFPEILDGRVKTLHPRVHAGILAVRDNPEHAAVLQAQAIAPIDLVVCNLYPFEATVARAGSSHEDIVENIDVGGPSMVRAAAKNYHDVAVLTDPGQYPAVLDELRTHGGRARPRDARAPGRGGVHPHRRVRPRHQRLLWRPAGGRGRRLSRGPGPILPEARPPALRRKSPPASRFLRRAGRAPRLRGHGRDAARQGAVVQQPARPR